MSVAFRQLKTYLRGTLFALVAVAIGLVLVKNRGHEVTFWFFWLTDESEPVNVVYLMLCTAAGTLAAWWLLSLARGWWRDLCEIKRLQGIEQTAQVLDRRAAELDVREHRVDEKLKDAIATDKEVGDE